MLKSDSTQSSCILYTCMPSWHDRVNPKKFILQRYFKNIRNKLMSQAVMPSISFLFLWVTGLFNQMHPRPRCTPTLLNSGQNYYAFSLEESRKITIPFTLGKQVKTCFIFKLCVCSQSKPLTEYRLLFVDVCQGCITTYLQPGGVGSGWCFWW